MKIKSLITAAALCATITSTAYAEDDMYRPLSMSSQRGDYRFEFQVGSGQKGNIVLEPRKNAELGSQQLKELCGKERCLVSISYVLLKNGKRGSVALLEMTPGQNDIIAIYTNKDAPHFWAYGYLAYNAIEMGG